MGLKIVEGGSVYFAKMVLRVFPCSLDRVCIHLDNFYNFFCSNVLVFFLESVLMAHRKMLVT